MNRQIGRILQQNQRAAARFAIALEPDACPGGLSPPRRSRRRVRRLGRALGGRLSAALEHQRLERSTALEGLHPTHPGRSRVSHPERSAEPASDLASARGSRSGPHPRLLSRLRAVEEPRDVAERAASATRRAPSSKNLRASSRTTSSCRPPPHGRDPPALRHPARRRPGRAPRPPRHRPAQAHAPRRTRACRRLAAHRLNPTSPTKCSDERKLAVILHRMLVTATPFNDAAAAA